MRIKALFCFYIISFFLLEPQLSVAGVLFSKEQDQSFIVNIKIEKFESETVKEVNNGTERTLKFSDGLAIGYTNNYSTLFSWADRVESSDVSICDANSNIIIDVESMKIRTEGKTCGEVSKGRFNRYYYIKNEEVESYVLGIAVKNGFLPPNDSKLPKTAKYQQFLDYLFGVTTEKPSWPVKIKLVRDSDTVLVTGVATIERERMNRDSGRRVFLELASKSRLIANWEKYCAKKNVHGKLMRTWCGRVYEKINEEKINSEIKNFDKNKANLFKSEYPINDRYNANLLMKYLAFNCPSSEDKDAKQKIREFKNAGIDLKHKDIFGRNALFYSLHFGCLNFSKELWANGLKYNDEDIFGIKLVTYFVLGKKVDPEYLDRILKETKIDDKEFVSGVSWAHYEASPVFAGILPIPKVSFLSRAAILSGNSEAIAKVNKLIPVTNQEKENYLFYIIHANRPDLYTAARNAGIDFSYGSDPKGFYYPLAKFMSVERKGVKIDTFTDGLREDLKRSRSKMYEDCILTSTSKDDCAMKSAQCDKITLEPTRRDCENKYISCSIIFDPNEKWSCYLTKSEKNFPTEFCDKLKGDLFEFHRCRAFNLTITEPVDSFIYLLNHAEGPFKSFNIGIDPITKNSKGRFYRNFKEKDNRNKIALECLKYKNSAIFSEYLEMCANALSINIHTINKSVESEEAIKSCESQGSWNECGYYVFSQFNTNPTFTKNVFYRMCVNGDSDACFILVDNPRLMLNPEQERLLCDRGELIFSCSNQNIEKLKTNATPSKIKQAFFLIKKNQQKFNAFMKVVKSEEFPIDLLSSFQNEMKSFCSAWAMNCELLLFYYKKKNLLSELGSLEDEISTKINNCDTFDNCGPGCSNHCSLYSFLPDWNYFLSIPKINEALKNASEKMKVASINMQPFTVVDENKDRLPNLADIDQYCSIKSENGQNNACHNMISRLVKFSKDEELINKACKKYAVSGACYSVYFKIQQKLAYDIKLKDELDKSCLKENNHGDCRILANLYSQSDYVKMNIYLEKICIFNDFFGSECGTYIQNLEKLKDLSGLKSFYKKICEDQKSRNCVQSKWDEIFFLQGIKEPHATNLLNECKRRNAPSCRALASGLVDDIKYKAKREEALKMLCEISPKECSKSD
ncbi:MAG: hypothetical protein M9962_13870 [Oligoflexia bacterium]|nr:hypothetical protein [Oligoflexia bacterium]